MNSNRKLVAALACRNAGSRLYGKPLQNLDPEMGYRIIDNVIQCLQQIDVIDEIVLAISEGDENEIYKSIAQEYGLQFIVGDERDVLSRLIKAGQISSATEIFRVTTESPFLHGEQINNCWELLKEDELDAVFLEPIIDGCGFEIISLNALQVSHTHGDQRHRSELCTLYIRENAEKFRTKRIEPAKELQRFDLRLTVDNPEDLVVCRHVYKAFKEQSPNISVGEIVRFLDRNPDLISLTAPFAELGYKTMYL